MQPLVSLSPLPNLLSRISNLASALEPTSPRMTSPLSSPFEARHSHPLFQASFHRQCCLLNQPLQLLSNSSIRFTFSISSLPLPFCALCSCFLPECPLSSLTSYDSIPLIFVVVTFDGDLLVGHCSDPLLFRMTGWAGEGCGTMASHTTKLQRRMQ